MKVFLLSLAAAVLIAVVSAVILDRVDSSTATMGLSQSGSTRL